MPWLGFDFNNITGYNYFAGDILKFELSPVNTFLPVRLI